MTKFRTTTERPGEGDDQDLMFSHGLSDTFEPRDEQALPVLLALFTIHGRRSFVPDPERDWRHPEKRGWRQEFARSIAILHVRGHLRWFPGGRYRIVSRWIYTVGEFKREYPDALWHGNVAWPDGEAEA